MNRRLAQAAAGTVTPQRTIRDVPFELQQVQRAVERSTRHARSDQHSRGRRVRVVAPGTGVQTISHGLGRKPYNFDPVQLKGAMSYTIGATNSRTFLIACSGPGTLDFWVW